MGMFSICSTSIRVETTRAHLNIDRWMDGWMDGWDVCASSCVAGVDICVPRYYMDVPNNS